MWDSNSIEKNTLAALLCHETHKEKTKSCNKNWNSEKNTLQSYQEGCEDYVNDIDRLKKEEMKLLYQNQSAYLSRVLSGEFECPKTSSSENTVDSIKVYCKICHKGYHVSSDKLFFCTSCKFYYHQSCHDTLTPNILMKDGLQWSCFKCQIEKCIKDENIKKFSQNTPHELCNQLNVTDSIKNIIQFTAHDPSITMRAKKSGFDPKIYHFFDNKSQLSTNDHTKNSKDFKYHFKDTNTNADLNKMTIRNTFVDDHLKNTLCYDNIFINEDNIIECSTESKSEEIKLNTESSDKSWLNNTYIDSMDTQNDYSDCIDVQDVTYEPQIETEKKIFSGKLKKRGRLKKSRIVRKPIIEKITEFKKKIKNASTIRHVFKPLRNKRKSSKKQVYTQSSKYSGKYTKSIKNCSDIVVLKTKPVNLVKTNQILESCKKHKGSRKKKYRDTDDYCLIDATQMQEFSHLFEPAPKLPVETKDGQRLGKKYRKKYNICDLRYVHVHRQTAVFTPLFSNMNENQNRNNFSFDILNLVPQEVVPVITNNSQLGFREAIIDKRLMRYKRGVPIFRVGRKIPGELS
ncbi:hypothetical protein PCANB_000302 [Pneumocystis canis]|nr:hypothetical protein PCANB_000302 [Pneumocystis canis]